PSYGSTPVTSKRKPGSSVRCRFHCPRYKSSFRTQPAVSFSRWRSVFPPEAIRYCRSYGTSSKRDVLSHKPFRLSFCTKRFSFNENQVCGGLRVSAWENKG